MIELEKTIPYWWEKIADKHKQIVRMSDNAPAHVIRTERESMGRMYKQLQTYVHHERRSKFRGWNI